MEPLSEQKYIMIIAGEASGDLHGSRLVTAMRERNKALFFCGIGGQALKASGVRVFVDASELSVVGITEAFSKLPNLLKGMAVAKKTLKRLLPDLLILIDFPDFNLNVAAFAKKLGIPVLYYISPQIWAWRPGRVKKIGKIVDHMVVILPFEEDFYRKHEIPVTYVHIICNPRHQNSRLLSLKKRNGKVLDAIIKKVSKAPDDILSHIIHKVFLAIYGETEY